MSRSRPSVIAAGARPAVGALLAAWCVAAPSAAWAGGPPVIALVGAAAEQPFWEAVRQGALRQAGELGISATFDAPAGHAMADEQVALAAEVLKRHPSVLCIAPLDGVASVLQEAKRARVSVIALGGETKSPVPACTVGTDQAAAASLAADKVAALIGRSGKVGLIAADSAVPDLASRCEGFLLEMRRRYPGVEVIGPRYSGADRSAAAEAAKAMMQEAPDLAAFFGADEETAAGIAEAIRARGLAGRVIAVGFDSGIAQTDAIRSGLMAGAITQDPVRLGARAVAAAVDLLNGRWVPRRIDSGFHWYDRTNIGDPSIVALLHP